MACIASRLFVFVFVGWCVIYFAAVSRAAVEYTVTDLGARLGAPAPGNVGSAINAGGEVLGGTQLVPPVLAPVLYNHGYLFANGGVMAIPALPAPYNVQSEANSINDNGQIVGEWGTADELTADPPSDQAFLYSNGVMTSLGPGFAMAINDAGAAVGFSLLDGPAGPESASLFINGEVVQLGNLGGMESVAEGINDLGDIVGYSDTPTGTDGFIYSDGVMQDLNSLIDPSSGWTIIDAEGINDAGQIVSTGYYGGVDGEFNTLLLTPLPEPAPAIVFPALAACLLARRPRSLTASVRRS